MTAMNPADRTIGKQEQCMSSLALPGPVGGLSIRPAYRADRFVGFYLQALEPVGKVYRSYKHAALARREFA